MDKDDLPDNAALKQEANEKWETLNQGPTLALLCFVRIVLFQMREVRTTRNQLTPPGESLNCLIIAITA